jgi:hypothetical protein
MGNSVSNYIFWFDHTHVYVVLRGYLVRYVGYYWIKIILIMWLKHFIIWLVNTPELRRLYM